MKTTEGITNRGLLLGITALLAIAAVGCGNNKGQGALSFDEGSSPAIVGGSPVDASEAIAKSTVAFYFNGFPDENRVANFCTGTVIGRRTILTAAHCFVDAADANGMTLNEWTEKTRVGFGTQVIQKLSDSRVRLVRIHSVSVHPEYVKDSVGQATEVAMPDVAVVTLAENIPSGYVPVRMVDSKARLVQGLELTLAGYGLTNGRLQTSATELRKVNVVVDNPEITSAQFTYRVVSSRSACSGDSGGPAFVQVGSRLEVIGVTSWGDLTCSIMGGYTSVPAFASWIRGAAIASESLEVQIAELQ